MHLCMLCMCICSAHIYVCMLCKVYIDKMDGGMVGCLYIMYVCTFVCIKVCMEVYMHLSCRYKCTYMHALVHNHVIIYFEYIMKASAHYRLFMSSFIDIRPII